MIRGGCIAQCIGDYKKSISGIYIDLFASPDSGLSNGFLALLIEGNAHWDSEIRLWTWPTYTAELVCWRETG